MPGISPHYNSHRSIFLFSALNSTPTFTTSRLSDKESDSLFHQSAAKPARQSHSVYIFRRFYYCVRAIKSYDKLPQTVPCTVLPKFLYFHSGFHKKLPYLFQHHEAT